MVGRRYEHMKCWSVLRGCTGPEQTEKETHEVQLIDQVSAGNTLVEQYISPRFTWNHTGRTVHLTQVHLETSW